MAGRTAKIEQGEIILLGILVGAGAAPHNLLELRHGTDGAIQYNQVAGLGIDAGRKQAQGGDDGGIPRFGVNKVAELVGSVRVVAGNAHNIAPVLMMQSRIFVNKRLAFHQRQMIWRAV